MQQINNKIIQRAIAQSIVNDAPLLIKMVQKYEPINKNVSSLDLLLIVQGLLSENKQFALEYTQFLIKKGWLSDYNKSNASGIIAGLTTIVSSVIKSGETKKERQLEYSQISSENTQQLMQLMMQEEQANYQKQRQKNNLLYISIGSMVLLIGIIIFAKKM